MMFTCPSCGRRTKTIIEGLCPKCYAKKVLPEGKEWYLEINLKQCAVCGTFFYKNKPLEPTVNNFEKILRDFLSKEKNFKLINLKILNVNYEANEYVAFTELHIKIKNVHGKLKRILVIPIKKVVCKDCTRVRSEYYEAKIQIRGSSIDKYVKEIKMLLEKNNIPITKEEILKEGIDLYVYNTYRLLRLINRIKRIYNVEVKITRKLHTKDRQTSKQIYKLTVLLRFLK